jgi:hypothetical protein
MGTVHPSNNSETGKLVGKTIDFLALTHATQFESRYAQQSR